MATARKNAFDSFSAFDFKNSNIDVQKLGEIQQSSIDALTKANQVMLTGLQGLIKAQTEFFQEQAQAAAGIATQTLSAKSPEEGLDTQTRFAQHYFDANMQNAQTLAKAASETAVKVFDILNNQSVSNLNELTKLAKKAANS